MTGLSEDAVEQFALQLLEAQGYTVLHRAPPSLEDPTAERQRFTDVMLRQRLEAALQRINPTATMAMRMEALRQLTQPIVGDLMGTNAQLHHLLTMGIAVSTQQDGGERGERLWALDFANPANNEFIVVNQLTVQHETHEKRPDLVLFVNGLPLVVIELKNPTDEHATLESAYRQLDTYTSLIPTLFATNAILILSDGMETRVGALAAAYSRFLAWKRPGNTDIQNSLAVTIADLLNPTTLLDIIRHFIVFEETTTTDLITTITTKQLVKKLAAYHQYYAVNAAVAATLAATGIQDAPFDPILFQRAGIDKPQPPVIGSKQGGVIWHTQGSGKSLSMVFFVGKLVLALNNPTILMLTDRNDLDDQLFDTFAATKELLRQNPIQASDRAHLKRSLAVNAGGIIFSTIQKFLPESGTVFDTLSERGNIVVIADEAHRSQYGFDSKTTVTGDEQDGSLMLKTSYGFAKYLRDALPNATYVGFTGTPIERHDINTPAVFGPYVAIYDIADAVEDGATVRIYYESRLAKVGLTADGRDLIAALDHDLDADDPTIADTARQQWDAMETLIGSQDRIRTIAADIVNHFEARTAALIGKGMIVTMSRRIAAALYEAIIALRPDWHHPDLNQGRIKVVMSAASNDGATIAKHHTTKEQRRRLAERLKDDHDPLHLVIVRDMWLTGFDAPNLHTMYLDKPMKGHSLMQAIARVNRVYKDKPGGLIVDYLGIAADLKHALSFYADAGGRGDPALIQEQAVRLMQEYLEIIQNLFFGFPHGHYPTADTGEKLRILLEATNHILGLADNGKDRFVKHVAMLNQAYALAIPHPEALDQQDLIGFYQAVKARLVKVSASETGRSASGMETAIRQVIDAALVAEPVIDVFDAAGIKKPDIAILSDDFLAELKDYQHQHLAAEVLNKLLRNELTIRARTNLVQSTSLLEQIDRSMHRYHNRVLTAAEVIEELIALSKQIIAADREAQNLNLTAFEYAFYTAVASQGDARQLMEQRMLRELAVVLTEQVRQNTSIDWTIRESARAKLRIMIKRVLNKYGYPPNMQALATETVIKQAEMLARELVG